MSNIYYFKDILFIYCFLKWPWKLIKYNIYDQRGRVSIPEDKISHLNHQQISSPHSGLFSVCVRNKGELQPWNDAGYVMSPGSALEYGSTWVALCLIAVLWTTAKLGHIMCPPQYPRLRQQLVTLCLPAVPSTTTTLGSHNVSPQWIRIRLHLGRCDLMGAWRRALFKRPWRIRHRPSLEI